MPAAEKARSGVKRFACSFSGCEVLFSRRDDALRLERKHTGERPFKCAFCE